MPGIQTQIMVSHGTDRAVCVNCTAVTESDNVHDWCVRHLREEPTHAIVRTEVSAVTTEYRVTAGT
jgi:hypothetical protein